MAVRAISAELVAESSLQIGNAYPKLSTVLQVKSIALYHDTVLCLMVDGADSKKKNALFSEKLQSVTTEIQTFININFEFEFQSL